MPDLTRIEQLAIEYGKGEGDTRAIEGMIATLHAMEWTHAANDLQATLNLHKREQVVIFTELQNELNGGRA